MKIWIDGSGWNGHESRFAVVFEDGRIVRAMTMDIEGDAHMDHIGVVEVNSALSVTKDERVFQQFTKSVGHDWILRIRQKVRPIILA